MKKILTARQLSIILFISVVSLKLLVFPALITKYAGRDAFVSIFLYLVVEFTFVMLVYLFMRKYPSLTFYDAISQSMGTIVAKIVYGILFIYFLSKSLFLIKETHNYFLEVIFDSLPWLYFTIPLTAFICYVMSKSAKSMARTIEILFWFIVVSISITAIAPSHRIDILNILPMFENGFLSVAEGMFFASFSFGDFLVMMMFMGRVRLDKSATKKIVGYGIFCVIFVTVFYIMFVATFDNSGINHILALSDISVRSSYPYTQEKLDWLAILIWTIVLLFQIGMYSLLTKNAICEVIPFKKKEIPIAIISTLLFGFSLLLYFNLEFLVKVVSSVPFLIVVISIHVLMLIVLFICFVILRSKRFDSDSHSAKLSSTTDDDIQVSRDRVGVR